MAEFTIVVQGTGWVGLGVAAGTGVAMVDADIVMAHVLNDGSAWLDDMWATSYNPPQSDTSMGCNSQAQLLSATQAAGVTTVTFRRPLAASDRCDRALVKDGRNNLIYAWNPDTDDMTQYHGSNRGLLNILLSSTPGGRISAIEEQIAGDPRALSTLRLHGVLLIVAFCYLLPLATLAVRLEEGSLLDAIFTRALHIGCNVAAVAFAAAGFALNFARIPELQYGTVPFGHGTIGIVVMALFFLQILYPWVRPPPRLASPHRRTWILVHTCLGRAIVALGLLNVALGVYILSTKYGGDFSMYAALAATPVSLLAVAASFVDHVGGARTDGAGWQGRRSEDGGSTLERPTPGTGKSVDDDHPPAHQGP
ncbi:hypothetical protein GPECTOR_24g188 [Gonium pectorale]|uniref:Cytochrome b561 domain-containing protein n=1 Tax=Gonium pectorale TaxID=33097 RepID=A0A150GGD3_GONPE|nr:hypothetical protein GPECTOR_24g188 [Gonium pectorale]|eukprot:KXZ48899.1 hypothetical protein GPECTOR_24g188 [Gonium pectorale]